MATTNIENPYIGAFCRKGNKIIMESTPAGYCLGTWDDEGPCCRVSSFSDKKNAKYLVPDRVCDENILCNGGCGCGIQLLKNSETAQETGSDDEYVYYVIEEISAKLVAVPKKVIEEAANGLPDTWTAEEIVEEVLEGLWKEEKIVLDSDNFQEVYFKEVTEESEYSYLLDSKDKAQVLTELSVE